MDDLLEKIRELELAEQGGNMIIAEQGAEIKALQKRIAELEAKNARLGEALKPLSAGVFNDNGDITVTHTSISPEDRERAYWELRRSCPRVALEQPQ